MKKIFMILSVALLAALNLRAGEPAKSEYPLTTCLISGEKLGSMGKPYVLTYQGTEVKFCCSHCKPEFEKDPAKYLKAIEDAKAAGK